MTNRETSAEIADEAARLVVRMEGGAWSGQDEADLQSWLKGDVRRRGALLQAQAAWVSLEPPVYEDTVVRRRYVAMPRRTLLLSGGGALAASLLGGLLWFRSGATYKTELGEVRSVPLADGSTATINSGSELEVKLVEHRREIQLARGEVWFRVAKDAQRPFIVEAGQVVVQAVGTAFSVRRRDNGADIFVTEGVVETWTAQADGHRVRLSAGQRAFVGNNSAIELLADAPSAVDRALAWRSGLIDLSGQNLGDAVEEFNRYNRRKLVLVDSSLRPEQLDGIFRTDDPVGFAAAVGSSFSVPVDLSDKAVIRIGHQS